MNSNWLIAGALALSVAVSGCGSGTGSSTSGTTGGTPAPTGTAVTGSIRIDGSSTVFPITAALVEVFRTKQPDVQVAAAEAGTGAGFKKFATGEIDIANASKPISTSQVEAATKGGVEFIELPIAYDGLSIVVNKDNTWLKSITTEQLSKIWNKDSKVKMWSDVDPSWPKQEIKLYGPTSDHGSYEYFNEVISGDKANARQDYEKTNDYNALVAGVGSNKGALGYVGFAYVKQNPGMLRVIPVDAGKGAIEPSDETIMDGTYAPLSRPLLMYVNKKSAAKPEVKAFIEFALGEGKEAVSAAGFVPLPDDLYAKVLARFQAGKTGTIMEGAAGMKLSELLAKE